MGKTQKQWMRQCVIVKISLTGYYFVLVSARGDSITLEFPIQNGSTWNTSGKMNPLGLEWFESKAKNLCGNLSINDQFVGLASLLVLGYFRDVAKGGAEGPASPSFWWMKDFWSFTKDDSTPKTKQGRRVNVVDSSIDGLIQAIYTWHRHAIRNTQFRLLG